MQRKTPHPSQHPRPRMRHRASKSLDDGMILCRTAKALRMRANWHKKLNVKFRLVYYCRTSKQLKNVIIILFQCSLIVSYWEVDQDFKSFLKLNISTLISQKEDHCLSLVMLNVSHPHMLPTSMHSLFSIMGKVSVFL